MDFGVERAALVQPLGLARLHAPSTRPARSSSAHRHDARELPVPGKRDRHDHRPETGFTLDFSEPYYGLTTDPPPDGIVVENRPDTAETYDGVELQLLKSFSDGWMLRVGFAYNNWRQQIGPGGIVDPNNERAGHECQRSRCGRQYQRDLAIQRQRHRGLPFAIQAGVNLFGRQGFPILYFVEASTYDERDSVPRSRSDPPRTIARRTSTSSTSSSRATS